MTFVDDNILVICISTIQISINEMNIENVLKKLTNEMNILLVIEVITNKETNEMNILVAIDKLKTN